jgi:predicted nucleic acid-binding protein
VTQRPRPPVFFDSNVPLYLLSADTAKAARAEDLMADGGTISVQVLNEFTAVARRKYTIPWPTILDVLDVLKQVCRIEPLTLPVHERALVLAQRFGIPIYDATIAASALQAGCAVLYSEDFQHGQSIEGLSVRNPFASAAGPQE